ncbi:DUF3573 domain-containing protein [Francisella sp. LA112445]|uniref:DUF3573 domain-containing protein n=1 Tax=Francisella sp. LA112445 TaxID=1395624 RepID=UPI001788C657|nr:DUF3573 domain-containing protein [Francisella sp. LA112445]QIW09271.1 DUF3573 domain-containing protein [Francisella sp. LA112445]
MRFIFKFLVILVVYFFLFNVGNSSENQNAETQIDIKDIRVLQKKLSALKEEIKEVKESQYSKTFSSRSDFATYGSKVVNPSVLSPTKISVYDANYGSKPNYVATRVASNETFDQILKRNRKNKGVFFSNGSIDVGKEPAITTQGQITYLGSYSGNNTIPIGQISRNLFSSTIIGQKDKFGEYSMFFGGYLEADAQTWFGSQINRIGGVPNFPSTGQNIHLTTMDLYFLANVGHYVTAVFDFVTDENNDFGLRNGFVILGNLDVSPFFVTIGHHRRLSFGTYGGGGPWSNGITADFLAPDSVSDVAFNYKTNTINANIAVFGTQENHPDFSAAIFYANKLTMDLSYGFNFGYIFNIAGAGNNSIRDFLDNVGKSDDNLGVINIDGTLAYSVLEGILQFQSGWATTVNKEDFNNDGTNVNTGAWYVSLAYGIKLYGRNTNVNFSYGQSYNAGNIPMPLSNASPTFGLSSSGIKNQWIVSAQRSYFDNNVLLGPEYSYQRLYNNQQMNTLTLDLSVYV